MNVVSFVHALGPFTDSVCAAAKYVPETSGGDSSEIGSLVAVAESTGIRIG